MLLRQENTLVFRYDAEELRVQPWGPNAFRVRSTKSSMMPTENWALLPAQPIEPEIHISDDGAVITNGKAKVHISSLGKLVLGNARGTVSIEEYVRNRRDLLDPKCSAIEVEAREFKGIPGTDNFRLTMRWESPDPNEKIFGMGQYQQPWLDLKGQDLELAHRNSQASVPFALSSLGYGILWNNPSIGRAVFGKNITTFEAYSTKALDYWIVFGDSPAEIVESYAGATGKVPMMPEYGLGFWQCKLRYQSQQELLEVARQHKARKIPLDLIVVDFFHWPKQGEWKFDPTYWPDPDAMVRELKDMGVELMVSIWPTVDKKSENYHHLLEYGYLIRTDRGVRTGLDFEGETIHIDVTNPRAREWLWSIIRKNYFSKGIKTFWLDEAEPEYTVYDFDNYRYFLGSNSTIGNVYPVEYAKAFYEGQQSEGQADIVNLVRCAWAGSQRYGALVWSGDIASSWASFRNQLAAGLSMAIAGIPWWTTDIGGFHGGDPDDPKFRELFVRWFQWGAFCPVMRLHGDREPRQPQQGTTGGATCCSGAANEVWSYGPEVYDICRKYIQVRESLRDYTRRLMREAHEKGSPIMRPLFYEFPGDKRSWETSAQYMYGDRYLVCPVLDAGVRALDVYLPPLEDESQWTRLNGGETYSGGQVAKVACPLDEMPVFMR
ncbi:glycosyl hydrolases family 31-domain-containing protein [Fusarium solani]|uniref:Glycosyl hydrolases family 31-domain-containing protein n=1 Tax=Fusarium solani TaxID=169388 RepID=A0A9P9H0W6_FUSSL|nr:glycosyl hydrolases family 31-domain-containing protein [Fusarium solani]KAH7247837.1 glycosyl hydrolases family 31-domain-containing protein [Fusarium solani]